MKEGMHLKIISPEKLLFEGGISRLLLPGSKGQFEVLSNHAPIISSLGGGDVIYTTDTKEETSIPIQSGFVRVENNEIVLCIE